MVTCLFTKTNQTIVKHKKKDLLTSGRLGGSCQDKHEKKKNKHRDKTSTD